MFNEITEDIDLALVVTNLFFVFFFGLVWWLRREDRREGYPLERDNPRRVGQTNNVFFFPTPKTFIRPDGSTYVAPNFERDEREFAAERVAPGSGSAFEPVGEPMLAAVGPGAYAEREDEPELTRQGHIAIVPMRVATDYSIAAGPDPRGWPVVGADGEVAGTVSDVWVDRADMMVRYLEVELAGSGNGSGVDVGVGTEEAGTRLVPITMLLAHPVSKKVEVSAVRAEHFASVPTLKAADQVTLLEEEKISAFYAAGRLYASPGRLGPVV
ncbi:MAG: photosynthetic reaction center subunit H [Sandaracinaceae bacterium]